MDVYEIAPNLKLLALDLPVAGWKRFFGAYVFTGDRKAIVDVGPSAAAPELFSGLSRLGIGPEEIDYVILTHIHLDHGGGAGTVLRRMPRAKVVAHPSARRHLVDPARLWEASLEALGSVAGMYGPMDPVPAGSILDATDGMELDLGTTTLQLVLTPGHAPHHLCVFDKGGSVLLVGDAAGVCADGNLRVGTPAPFRFEETMASLNKLIALEPGKLCYAHLGCYENAVERLESMKRSLLLWREVVARETKAGRDDDAILAVLVKEDRGLDYLKRLDRHEYERERMFLINSVHGMAGSLG